MQRATAVVGGTKEKLVFLAASTLLALTAYGLLATSPVVLEVSNPASPVPPPMPLSPEKLDVRVSDARFYLESGKTVGIRDPKTNQFADRERHNPFQPVEVSKIDNSTEPRIPKIPKGITFPNPNEGIIPGPPSPPNPIVRTDEFRVNPFAVNDRKAEVEFSGVMTMNGRTYGLLKSKNGSTTIRVSVGDYLDEYKYTVTRIEKQAIYVVDNQERMFIASENVIK